jgi:16S rRNA G966 N2-methylase RsmD
LAYVVAAHTANASCRGTSRHVNRSDNAALPRYRLICISSTSIPACSNALSEIVNQLHSSDALHFARELLDQSIDKILTDPPYSSGGLHAGTRAQSPMQKYIGSDTKTVYEDVKCDNMDQRAWAF